jgi:hypothetical protein
MGGDSEVNSVHRSRLAAWGVSGKVQSGFPVKKHDKTSVEPASDFTKADRLLSELHILALDGGK